MKRPAELTRISPQVPGEFRPDPLEAAVGIEPTYGALQAPA
jgi:hypothetical protein